MVKFSVYIQKAEVRQLQERRRRHGVKTGGGSIQGLVGGRGTYASEPERAGRGADTSDSPEISPLWKKSLCDDFKWILHSSSGILLGGSPG